MARYILGVSNLDDSGISLISEDGEIVLAVNEERLNRKKLYAGFPSKALDSLNGHFDIAKIAVANLSSFTAGAMYKLYYGKPDSIFSYLPFVGLFGEWIRSLTRKLFVFYRPICSRLKKYYPGREIVSIQHHLAHAAGAYYTSNRDKALIITMDAYGDGNASIVALGQGRDIAILREYGWGATAAHLYARITQYLGFKSHCDEGKIMGLAAYGDPQVCYTQMEKLLWLDPKKGICSPFFLRSGFNKRRLDRLFAGQTKEDIAAALQKRVEDIVVAFVKKQVKDFKGVDLVVSGGVFANVKLNQKIHELPEVKSLYVFPHMGDGGLSLGAALAMLKPNPFYLKHVYLGNNFTVKEIENCLKKTKNITYTYSTHFAKEVARLLSEGKSVAVFQGKMEYGPRALGNRSILYQTTDTNAKEKINKMLKRTEFMPFAPVTLFEYADQCYENVSGAEYAARFMTISFNATNWMKEHSPGAVHIDGTVRPQLLQRDDNGDYYDIIDEYRKLTGIPSLLNTSFNMHEEPIVMSPQQAVSSFLRSQIDYLLIEGFLVQAS